MHALQPVKWAETPRDGSHKNDNVGIKWLYWQSMIAICTWKIEQFNVVHRYVLTMFVALKLSEMFENANHFVNVYLWIWMMCVCGCELVVFS